MTQSQAPTRTETQRVVDRNPLSLHDTRTNANLLHKRLVLQPAPPRIGFQRELGQNHVYLQTPKLHNREMKTNLLQVKLVLAQAPLIIGSPRVDQNPIYLHNTAPQQRDECQPSTQENNATWDIPIVEAHGF